MDSSEHELVPLGDEPQRTEQALQQFRPRPVNLDRERLMFLAGLEAGGGGREMRGIQRKWIWPAATFAMGSLAACLAVALTVQLSRPPMVQVIVREVPSPAPSFNVQADLNSRPETRPSPEAALSPVLSLPLGSAFQMRNTALRFGVDALPLGMGSHSASDASTPADQPLRGVLGNLDSSR